jgi:hypothetical protein
VDLRNNRVVNPSDVALLDALLARKNREESLDGDTDITEQTEAVLKLAPADSIAVSRLTGGCIALLPAPGSVASPTSNSQTGRRSSSDACGEYAATAVVWITSSCTPAATSSTATKAYSKQEHCEGVRGEVPHCRVHV